MKPKLQNDKYRKSRGGYSRLLSISCLICGKQICFYQKDGPGNLRRMYIDRILNNKVPITGKNFKCPLRHLLGVKVIYEKENRPAFRLFVDSVEKKITRGL